MIPLKVYEISLPNNIIFMQLGFSVSNWQKVQLNTHLFSDTQKYLYTNQMAWLKGD